MCVEIVPQTCTRVNILSYTDLGVAVAIHGEMKTVVAVDVINKQTNKQIKNTFLSSCFKRKLRNDR